MKSYEVKGFREKPYILLLPTHSPEHQTPFPREIGQNVMRGCGRGHCFGHTRQQRQPGHCATEPTQLGSVHFQAAFD